MPDINLLKNTERPDDQAARKPSAKPDAFEMTNPAREDSGIGKVFSFLRRPASRPKPADSMSIGRKTGTDQRILSESRKSAPAMIRLPEEEDSYSVNLLGDVVANRIDPKQQLLKLGGVALGAAVLVVLAYVGLGLYDARVRSQVTATREEVQAVRQRVADLKDDEQLMNDTAKKVTAVTELVNRHIRWTKFFDRLEHYTLPTVTYGNVFNGSLEGSLALSGQATSFEDVAQQYLLFQQAVSANDFISEFSITGAQRQTTQSGGQIITFTVTMRLLPKLLENGNSTAAELTSTSAPSS